MASQTVVLIRSNPETSHRPVEALRIALGLSSQEPAAVILVDKAPLLLSESSEDLAAGEELQKYLPAFRESESPIYVEEGALKACSLGKTEFAIQPVTHAEIAQIMAEAKNLIVF